jgi:hypothetical protein
MREWQGLLLKRLKFLKSLDKGGEFLDNKSFINDGMVSSGDVARFKS